MIDEEKSDPVRKCLREEFDLRVSEKLGKRTKLEYFPEEDEIENPRHDLYQDDHGGGVETIPDCDNLGYQILIYILMPRSYSPSKSITKRPQSNAERSTLMATKWESHTQTQYLIREYMMLSFQMALKRSLWRISSPKICTHNTMQTEINIY